MHLAEAHAQPDKLGTIPDALWWAIVTIGTIGYGDVVPITALGKFVATGTIFAGLIMMALPIGIIATAFAEQIHRRDFIVTWGMIARVPLFGELDAAAISDIMELLRAQVVESGEVIVRAGDPAHSMYFIAAGEVEVALRRNACGSASASSSARWRCCAAPAARRPLSHSRAQICWCWPHRICTR